MVYQWQKQVVNGEGSEEESDVGLWFTQPAVHTSIYLAKPSQYSGHEMQVGEAPNSQQNKE